MNAIQPHLHILLAGWRQRRNLGSRWFWPLVVVLLYVLPTVLYITGRPAKVFLDYTAGFVLFHLLAYWALTVENLSRQNSPANARLVPHHPRLIRQSLLATWLALGLVTGAITGVAYSHGWLYGLGALLVMGVIQLSFWVPFLAWGLALAVVGLPLIPTLVGKTLVKEFTVRASNVYPTNPLVPLLTYAVLLIATLLLWHCISRFGVGYGDARHCRIHERRAKMYLQMQAMQSGQNPLRDQSQLAWRLNWLSWAPFRWRMQHLLRQAKPTAASVMARARIGFGPNFHWTTQVVVVTQIAGIIGVIGLIASATVGLEGFREMLIMGPAYITGIMFQFHFMSQQQSLRQSWREQSLLMLLPGMPRGGDLNRTLAAHWLIGFSALWLVFCSSVWAATRLLDLESWGMGFAIAMMPVSLLQLRDWSHWNGRTGGAVSGWTAFALAGALPAGGVCCWLLCYFELSPWPVMAIVAAVTMVALRWRWIQLGSYQQAMPVGRWG
jgi:hypothetical protein